MEVPERTSVASDTLLIATHNAGKVAEIARLLEGGPWRLRCLTDDDPDFPETGATFADNARGKALFYATHAGLPALADDSGLQIDALGGDPGVYSARYIDPEMSQAARNLAVLERLRDVPTAKRGAGFVCHLVLALPGSVVHETIGACRGAIAEVPRGDRGFGYDPIFLSPELGKTFAELSQDEKSQLSHRGQAVRKMVGFLRQWSPP